MNSLNAIYNASMGALPGNSSLQVDQCSRDCSLGSGSVPIADAQTYDQAVQGYTCGSVTPAGRADSACVLTGSEDEGRGLASVCRVADDWITMGGSDASTPVKI